MKLEQRLRQTDLNDMFAQKLNYEKHRKKLEQLENRKSYLIHSDRYLQLEAIKQRKHNTFVQEMIDRNNDICRDNGRIYDRLTHVREVHHPAVTPKETSYELRPFRKKQIIDTHRENLRLSEKLKSLVSSINVKKIEEEYEKSNKIRTRISRYQTSINSERKIPKSQKFLNLSLSRSRNSIKSAKNTLKKEDSTTAGHSVPLNLRPIKNRFFAGKTNSHEIPKNNNKNIFQRSIEAKPRTIASFYKREDILKNRVSQNHTMMSEKNRTKYRDRLSAFNRTINLEQEPSRSRSKSQDRNLTRNSFFPTQIQKEQKSKMKTQKKQSPSKKPTINKK